MAIGHMGMGRMLAALGGWGELGEAISARVGKHVTAVQLSPDKQRCTLTFADAEPLHLGVEGDCCSESWIEHLTVPEDIAGAVLTDVMVAVPSADARRVSTATTRWRSTRRTSERTVARSFWSTATTRTATMAGTSCCYRLSASASRSR
jgi:hypothetical protein